MFTPTSGSIAVLTVQMAGGTLQTVPAVNWTLEVDGKLFDASNFRDGRFRVPTLLDSTVTATLVWDSAEQQTKLTATGMRIGATGSVKCYTDATHFFVVPVIVGTLGIKNDGPEGVVMQDVSLSQSSQSGVAFAYPVDP